MGRGRQGHRDTRKGSRSVDIFDLSHQAGQREVAGKMKPGDVYLTNSPKDGAIHLPDWTLHPTDLLPRMNCCSSPVWAAHVADSGGALLDATFCAYDSIAEGLNIPLVSDLRRPVDIARTWLDLVLETTGFPT